MSGFKELGLREFIVLDIETTGTDAFTDRIIEVAALKFIDGKIDSEFKEFVDPGISIPEHITLLTGINNKDVQGKSSIKEIIPDMIEFLDGIPVVGHNIDFDMSFLEFELRSNEELEITSNLYDTLLLSRIFFPVEVSDHKLSTFARYFKMDTEGLHRARYDCIVTAELFKRIIERSLTITEGTVRKLAAVAGRSSNGHLKEFIIKLANHFLNTSFKRKLNKNEPKYSFSNILYSDNDIDESDITDLCDEGIIDKVFEDEGLLNSIISGFEYRQEQHEMARKCLKTLFSGKILTCEAGTGVGKSYAYLIPGAIHSLVNGERIVISTNTKTLQEQIFYKDLPVIHQIFNNTFKAVILKGRNNYICLSRYNNILKRPEDYLEADNIDNFLPLVYWAERTLTGDVEENCGFKMGYSRNVWSKVVSDKGFCSGKKCRHYESCFLQKARKNAYRANLVIINHSLLFSDLVSENAVLGKYGSLIIDEAHNIESSATKYLGSEFNSFLFKNITRRIYSPFFKNGIFNRIKAVSGVKTEKNIIDALNGDLYEKSNNINEIINKIFEEALEVFTEKYKKEIDHNNFKKRYSSIEEIFTDSDSTHMVRNMIEDIISIMRRLDIIFRSEADNKESFEELANEISSIKDQAEELYLTYEFFFNAQKDNFVYWCEISGYQSNKRINLYAAPLDVSSILKERLYENIDSLIMTSATMTIEGRFKYIINKLGLSDYTGNRLEELMLGSPFDLDAQMSVTVPSFISSPKNKLLYENDIISVLMYLTQERDDGTLVLFTNYFQMNSVHNKIRNLFSVTNRTIGIQNRYSGRSALIKQFRSVRNSFLLGTHSFWEGIDVPGDSLNTLIITKLPFSVPTEPVIQARTEEIEKQGRDSFMGYAVPEAVLKFKQGIGRLIRHRNDRGTIIILDSRSVNTRWGRAFINSLPVNINIPATKEELFQII